MWWLSTQLPLGEESHQTPKTGMWEETPVSLFLLWISSQTQEFSGQACCSQAQSNSVGLKLIKECFIFLFHLYCKATLIWGTGFKQKVFFFVYTRLNVGYIYVCKIWKYEVTFYKRRCVVQSFTPKCTVL